MIFELIALVFFCTAICFGFNAACDFEESDQFDKANKEDKKAWKVDQNSKMILWWARYYVGRHVNYFYSKPLYSCPVCMASVHSLIPALIFVYSHELSYKVMVCYPLLVLVVAGINSWVSEWLKSMDQS